MVRKRGQTRLRHNTHTPARKKIVAKREVADPTSKELWPTRPNP